MENFVSVLPTAPFVFKGFIGEDFYGQLTASGAIFSTSLGYRVQLTNIILKEG